MIGCAGEPVFGRGGLRVEGMRVIAVDVSGDGDRGMHGREVGHGECRRHVGGHGWGYWYV
jgi:hypothetical protein